MAPSAQTATAPSAAEQAQQQVNAALPRRAEFFVSDPHGEFEELQYIVKSGSGAVRALIDESFPGLPDAERSELATLVCYPEEKLPLLLAAYEKAPAPQAIAVATGGAPQTQTEYLAETLGRLVILAQTAAGQMPHSEAVALMPDLQPALADLLAAAPVHGIAAKQRKRKAPMPPLP